MKSFDVIFLVILSLGAGILISECIRRLNRKKSKIKILGTLMIPARYESMLSEFDEKLNIFIGVPGRDGSGDIYAIKDDNFSVKSYGEFDFDRTVGNQLIGATFKYNGVSFDHIVIPGKFSEGIATGAVVYVNKGVPEPCIINIILY